MAVAMRAACFTASVRGARPAAFHRPAAPWSDRNAVVDTEVVEADTFLWESAATDLPSFCEAGRESERLAIAGRRILTRLPGRG